MKKITARQLLVTFTPAMLVLLVIAVAGLLSIASIPSLTRDVAVIAGVHPFAGLVSNLGIFLWCVSAAVCFFSALVLRNAKRTKDFLFLLNSSLLSAYLMLDDAFLFHERLAHEYFGIDEKVVLAFLGAAVFVYLKSFLSIIVNTRYGVLFLAFIFLSLSVVVDSILSPWLWRFGQWEYFIEDGAKWLGIVSWCSYCVNTSYLFVLKACAFSNNADALGQ